MLSKKFAFLLLFLYLVSPQLTEQSQDHNELDSLTPYVDRHGSMFSHRQIRDCHEKRHGTAPHEIYPPDKSTNTSLPFLRLRRFVNEFGGRLVRGHLAIVSDPLKTISILEPGKKDGCKNSKTETVLETSKQRNCFIATNAGFFNTTSSKCLGNVISDGRLAFDSGGIQNAHFGIKKDGSIFTGYVSEDEVLKNPSDFQQLVGGVMWLLRNNTGYVDISKSLECEKAQETGSMDYFIQVLSARTAIGHDDNGRVILVHVDGKSSVDGVNLRDFEILLQGFGVRNAINLDGGGSSTFVVNGTVANYPYDKCSNNSYNCDRKVSTVICIHSPKCQPENCNNHGNCVNGQCICHEDWLAPLCNQLNCSLNKCSGNGQCIENDCICNRNFYGEICEISCLTEWNEKKCKVFLSCQNGGVPNFTSGICNCRPGFNGTLCETVCPFGYFGRNCSNLCKCRSNSCYCDPVDGSCVAQFDKTFDIYDVGSCIAESMFAKAVNDGLIPLTMEQIDKKRTECYNAQNQINTWHHTIVILSVITALSIAANVLLIFPSCIAYWKNKAKNTQKKYETLDALRTYQNPPESSDNDDG